MNVTSERTRKTEALVGLLATIVITFGLFLYILHEPARLPDAQAEIIAGQLDQAMTLYAENCAVCHGLRGEGIGSIPALDNPGLREMAYDDLLRVIARGRYGTAMPAWSLEDGGPLNDFEIASLVTLIRAGDWNATGERVVNLGLAPLIPFVAEPDPQLLEQLALLPDGAILQEGITLFAQNCVACHGADGLGSPIAPALNDPAVRAKSPEELTRVITYGNTGTLMAGWDKALDANQIAALVTLIRRWDEVPSGVIPAPETPVPVTAESLALGATLFSQNCARCHGPEGQGTQRAPALNVKSFLTSTSDLAMQQIITLGVPGTSMPAWGDRMTAAEIQAIVGFVRQWEATAPEVATPVRMGGGGPPWLRNTVATQTAGVVPPAVTATPASGAAPAVPTPTASAPAWSATPGTGTSPDGHSQAGSGGPPWAVTAQPASAPAASLDWRVILLVGTGLLLALILIAIGYLRLRKD